MSGKVMRLKFVHAEKGQEAEVITYGREVIFTTVENGKVMGGKIEGLNLSIPGILKDHPDLAGKPVEKIRYEGVRRFKEKLFGYPSWEARKNYIRDELEKSGYKLVMLMLPGQRWRNVG